MNLTKQQRSVVSYLRSNLEHVLHVTEKLLQKQEEKTQDVEQHITRLLADYTHTVLPGIGMEILSLASVYHPEFITGKVRKLTEDTLAIPVPSIFALRGKRESFIKSTQEDYLSLLRELLMNYLRSVSEDVYLKHTPDDSPLMDLEELKKQLAESKAFEDAYEELISRTAKQLRALAFVSTTEAALPDHVFVMLNNAVLRRGDMMMDNITDTGRLSRVLMTPEEFTASFICDEDGGAIGFTHPAPVSS